MAEKFDEFSKHLARKHSRRGAFKLFGAGIIGAAAATAFGQSASATPSFNQTYPHYNATFPDFNGNPKFNAVNQALIKTAEELQKVEQKLKIKIFFPWFK
ncbi:MAG: hypothetical protein AB7P33_03810 [Dehalococcoidia bacterium]